MEDDLKRKATGERIASVMKEKGITQMRLSEMTGFTQSVISEMVNGKRNNMPLAQYIADNFGKSLDWLINGTETKMGTAIQQETSSISRIDRIELSNKLSLLYATHQKLMEQAQDIFQEIVAINKLLIAGGYNDE